MFTFFVAAIFGWIIWAPLKEVNNLPPIVADVESHLPNGHPYRDSDLVGYVHEGTHGINSLLRAEFGCPGFYVLNNRAYLLSEPDTTLTKVARVVPISLRGTVYRLYLIESRWWWDKQPSYVFDEWVAYTNGTEARWQLSIKNRQETVQYMLEFCVYSACVTCYTNDPQTRVFYKWQLARSMKLYHASGLKSDYLVKLRTEPDAEQLRAYIRDYCGPRWTKKVMGF